MLIEVGYMSYIFVAQDLLQAKIARPDIEFMNLYKGDAYALGVMLTKIIPKIIRKLFVID